MRDLRLLEMYRQRNKEREIYGIEGSKGEGCFFVPSPTDKGTLAVVASSGEGWDHVSVSRANRCPNWPEMEFVKRLFFKDTETAMQLHVAVSEHISIHPHTLHMWRPHNEKIPLPPIKMV